MNLPRVLCLGEILFDCLADRLGVELNEVEAWTLYPGGAPANVACGLVKLGTEAGLISCLGEDEWGDRLFSLLETIGVDTRGLQHHASPTRRVYVTRSQTGERHFAGFGDISTDEFADTRLAAEKLPELLFDRADYLAIGTLALAYPNSRQAIYQALELARKHQVSPFVDINWRPIFWLDLEAAVPLIQSLLHQVDWMKCSDEEARWLFNTENPAEIAGQYRNLKGVLVTAGENGCAYQVGRNGGTVAAFSVNSVDTTGAGDSFVAGFLHQCCLKGDRILEDAAEAREAVIYASAAGAVTTTQPGAIAAQPNGAEVAEFLKRITHQTRHL